MLIGEKLDGRRLSHQLSGSPCFCGAPNPFFSDSSNLQTDS